SGSARAPWNWRWRAPRGSRSPRGRRLDRGGFPRPPPAGHRSARPAMMCSLMLDERRRTPALEAPVSESRPDAGVNMPAGVSLAIGAIVVVQVGHSLAVLLLERVGVMTSAAFRAGFSALIL